MAEIRRFRGEGKDTISLHHSCAEIQEGEGSEGKKQRLCVVYAREGASGKSPVSSTTSEANPFRSEVNETTSEVNESVSDVVGTTSSFGQAMMRNKALPLETKC